MGNVTISATEIRPLDGALTRVLKAGEAMTLGKCVQVAGDGDVEMANATTVAGADGVLGLVVAGADHDATGDVVANETVTIVVHGPVYLGPSAALDETKLYFVAETDGVITDEAPTNFRAVGYPLSATVIFWNPATGNAGS